MIGLHEPIDQATRDAANETAILEAKANIELVKAYTKAARSQSFMRWCFGIAAMIVALSFLTGG